MIYRISIPIQPHLITVTNKKIIISHAKGKRSYAESFRTAFPQHLSCNRATTESLFFISKNSTTPTYMIQLFSFVGREFETIHS